MKHLKALLLVVLLVSTLGMIVTTGHAQIPARPATPCEMMGCLGGPDFCGSIVLVINNVTITWICYTRWHAS